MGSEGRPEALEALFPLVYDELHRQAACYLRRERKDHTLQPTALINEAYLKLIDQKNTNWAGRTHFFAIAAQSMRRILVDYAKTRNREKRGGEPVLIAGIVQAPFAIRRLSFSADGKKIAYNTLRRNESISSVYLRANSAEANGAPFALISNASERNNFPVFSPDGKRLAFSSCSIGGTGCDVWLINPDGSNQTQLTTAKSNELLPGWFPDGDKILLAGQREDFWNAWWVSRSTRKEQQLTNYKSSIHSSVTRRGRRSEIKLLTNIRKRPAISGWQI